MKKKGRKSSPPATPEMPERRDFVRVFARRVLAWAPAVIFAWYLVTPSYNLFLTHATESLLLLSESPNATRLTPYLKHHLLVTRMDHPSSKGRLTSFKVTDTHFPLIMLGVFFLAVPGLALAKRLGPLGWALLISVFVHLLTLFCQIKSFYANGLGEWSVLHYGAFGQNFWGLSQHLLTIPLKLALPFLLWAAFYLHLLLPATTSRK